MVEGSHVGGKKASNRAPGHFGQIPRDGDVCGVFELLQEQLVGRHVEAVADRRVVAEHRVGDEDPFVFFKIYNIYI